jgi:hypothetical protein
VHQVVVDGLGHADHREAQRMQLRCDGHRTVAADGHHRVQPARSRSGHDLARHVGAAAAEVVKRVGLVVRAENRAALVEDVVHVMRGQRPHGATHQAEKAALDARDLGAGVEQCQRGRADHRVQARAVAAASEDADVHGAIVDASGCRHLIWRNVRCRACSTRTTRWPPPPAHRRQRPQQRSVCW